jgi:anti-anti-sigma regulatory factor
MSNSSVDVRTGVDGSLTIQPHGALNADCAVELQQILVHGVRRIRPLRMLLDLSDVVTVDPINLGSLAALCDLADDHHVIIFLDDPSTEVRAQLRAAGVAPQRFRYTRTTVRVDTPAVASMS